MTWNCSLDALFDHPYDSPFLGELFRAHRLRPKGMKLKFENGTEQVYHIRRQYSFEFRPKSSEDDEGRYNAFAIYVGTFLVRIKSIVESDGKRKLFEDIVSFELPNAGKLEDALDKWADFPSRPEAITAQNPPRYSRGDLLKLLRRYTQ